MKYYTKPSLKVVILSDTDLIATSDPNSVSLSLDLDESEENGVAD